MSEFELFKRTDINKDFARPIWSGMDCPEGWEYINLDEYTDTTGGYAFSSDNFRKENSKASYPLIKRSTINNNRKPEQHTIEDFDEKHLVKNEDLLVSMDGDFESMYWTYGEAALNQRTCKIDTDEKLQNQYLYYLLDILLEHTQRSMGATTVKSLSMKDFAHMNPAIPPLSEQRRIASVLYSVDEQLEVLHERKDKLSTLKHGLMQDLLTGEKRTINVDESDLTKESSIGVHPKDWGITTLDSDEIKVIGSGIEEYSGTKKYVATGDVKGRDIVGLDGFYEYDERPSRANLELKSNESILFAKMKDSIKVVKSTEKLDDILFSTGFIQLLPKDIEQEFLVQLLTFPEFDAMKSELATGTTQEAINMSDLSNIRVPVPSQDEQEKIGNILNKLDKMLSNTGSQIEKLERLKRGLMQDLLSGDTRTPEELEVLEDVVRDTEN